MRKTERSAGRRRVAVWWLPLLGVSLLMPTGWTGSLAEAQAVYVEDSPAAMELAERARRWREQGRLSDAVAALRELGETYGGKLMPVEAGRYVDAAWWVRRELAGDEQLRAVYEREAEPAAARALAAVLDGGAAEGSAEWYDADALAEVGRRYWLTPSGLSANLAWAAVMLERGEPAAALGALERLEEHPLAESVAARRAELREAARSLRVALDEAARRGGGGTTSDDAGPVGLDTSLWTLWWNDLPSASAWGGGGLLTSPNRRTSVPGATAWGVQPVPALTDDHVWATDGLRVVCVDRASGRVRWSFAWPALSSGPLQMGQVLPDRRSVAVRDGRAWVVLGPGRLTHPRARRGQLQQPKAGLWCLDAQSGAARWSVTPGELDEGWSQAQFMGTPVWAGSGVVAVRVRRVQLSGFVDSFVAGLDAGTGRLRWKRHLGSTSNAGMSATLPPAAPMLEAAGRLLVDEGLGVAAALDPSDGAVWWLRKTLAENDSENDADNADDAGMGMGARAANGRLVRGRPVLTSVQGQAGPVAVDAGVLVAVLDGGGATSPNLWGQRAWVLDPATGGTLRELEPEQHPWVRGGVWTPDGRGGLLVGAGGVLRRVDGGTLETVWDARPPGAALSGVNFPPVADGRHALLAGQNRTARVALAGGAVEGLAEWPAGVALAAGGGEVVTATAQAINAYVSVERGQQRLRRRIAEAPADPEPGLALATLGVRAERSQLLLDGVSSALRAIGDQSTNDAALGDDDVTRLLESIEDTPIGGSKLRDESFAELVLRDTERNREPAETDAAHTQRGVSVVLELIQLAASAEKLPPQTRRAVFDRVAAAITGPDELVAYHLALGPLEEEARRFGVAAGHYQDVLRNPLLSGRVVAIGGNQRRAGLEARQRLVELVARVGFEVYEPFELQARREFDELLADALTTPAQFAALADRYPLAEASAQSLLQAADRHLDDDRARAAVAPLRRAYRIAREDDTRASAVGQLASLYQQQGRPGTAVGWLQRVAREHPTLRPLRDGQPVQASQWIAELDTLADAARALPPFDPDSALVPWTVDGTLMQLADGAAETHRRDRAALRRGNRVIVYDLTTREAVGEQALPASDAVVLRFSDDQLVMFSSQRGQLYTLDLDAGPAEAFTAITVDELLATVGPATPAPDNPDLADFEQQLNQQLANQRLREARLRNNAAAVPNNVRRFAAAGDTMIVLADSRGRVLALDRLTLQPQWAFRSPAASTTSLTLDDETAVLAGVSAPGTDAQAGTVLALDLLTGQPRGAPILEASNPPLDARPMPDGTLLITFPTFVAAYSLDDTQLLWRTPRPFDIPNPFFPPPATGDGVLALTFPPQMPAVLLLDPATGQAQARLTLNRRANAPINPRQRLAAADGRLHVLAEQPECYADDGLLLWRSALDDPDVITLHQALTVEHVLILVQHTRPVEQGTPRYRLDAYRRDTGALVAQHPADLGRGSVIAPLSRVFDHAAAYATSQQTTFFFDSGP